MATKTRVRTAMALVATLTLSVPAASAPNAEAICLAAARIIQTYSPPAPETCPAAAAACDVDWLRLPSPVVIARYLPSNLRRSRQNVAIAMRCTVSATGALSDCVVLAQAPSKAGVENAVLRMAKHLRFSPRRQKGVNVESAVIIPILIVVGGKPAPELTFARDPSARLVEKLIITARMF